LLLVLVGLVLPVASLLPGDGPSARGASRTVTLEEFMIGVACVESGGDYGARNPTSDAYGKYQIMPFNWPVWAGWYLGDADAPQTPRNQETVARAEMLALRSWLDSGWPRVAYWWLTGRTHKDRSEWSSIARWYVVTVMRYARLARTEDGRRDIPSSCFSQPGDGRGSADGPGGGGGPVDEPVRISTVWLNVRRGPGLRSSILRTIAPATRLTVLGRDRDRLDRLWLEVRLPDGTNGWVASWYTRRG
jgi:hypothetical protein